MKLVARCLLVKPVLSVIFYCDLFLNSKMDKNKIALNRSEILIFLQSVTKSLAGVMIQEA